MGVCPRQSCACKLSQCVCTHCGQQQATHHCSVDICIHTEPPRIRLSHFRRLSLRQTSGREKSDLPKLPSTGHCSSFSLSSSSSSSSSTAAPFRSLYSLSA